MSTLLMEQLLSVIKEYREEKLSQEEALKSLEEKCKSATNENRQKMETIVDKYKYYLDIRYSKDDFIHLYDKSVNAISELERNEYEGRLSRKIGGILVERMSSVPPDEYETITEKDDEEIKDRIFQDRSEIALLCQENRKITEDYLSCKAEVEILHYRKEKENFSPQKTHQLGNPQWIKEQIERTIALLEAVKYIKRVKNKEGDFEYRMIKKISVRKIQDTLKIKKMQELIILPEIENIDDFMKKHLKTNKGNLPHDAIKEANRRKNNLPPKRTKAN